MKLSLWQQFSSNHSNGFSIIGVFSTEQDAEKAEARILKLFNDIASSERDEDGISLAEKEIGSEFGFEWTDGTDFFPQEAINRYRNLVEISAGMDSWSRKTSYEMLLQKLGAEVAGWEVLSVEDGETVTYFRVFLSADAATIEDASNIVQQLALIADEKDAKVSHDGTTISLSNILNVHQFSRIIRKLEDLSCTTIQYSFEKEEFKQK